VTASLFIMPEEKWIPIRFFSDQGTHLSNVMWQI